jgi:hypothetical protein
MGCGTEVSRSEEQLAEQRASCGKTIAAFQNFTGPARMGQEKNILPDAQKVRPARPQPMKAPEA